MKQNPLDQFRATIEKLLSDIERADAFRPEPEKRLARLEQIVEDIYLLWRRGGADPAVILERVEPALVDIGVRTNPLPVLAGDVPGTDS